MGDLSIFKRKDFQNDEVYQDIQRTIRLDPIEIKKNNVFLYKLLQESLIPEMKKNDPLFRKIFHNIMYGGSYYKRLKVSKPDEYDLNLMMRLPINKDNIQICSRYKSGYITLLISKSLAEEKKEIYQKFLEEGTCFLDQSKFRSWFQAVFDKAINNLSTQGFKIKYGQSGPAFTLYLKEQDKTIDIDLAPSLQFINMPIAEFDVSKEKIAWLALAKPLPDDVEKKNILWRTDFYKQEKELLKGQIKPIIRSIKKLRDFHNWTYLKSYAIETLCMNELEDERIEEHVQKSSRTQLLFYMMQALHRSLENNDLPNFWNEKQNLFSKSNEHIYKDMAKQLQRIMNGIQDNIRKKPKILIKYFFSEEEQGDLITKKKHALTKH